MSANQIYSRDALRDFVHDIHNFLRNNGFGYGMNALKTFNLFYGLRKLEDKMTPEFMDKYALTEECKYSNIKAKCCANIKGFEEFYNNILSDTLCPYNYIEEGYKNPKYNLRKVLYFDIPIEAIKHKVLIELFNKIDDLFNIEKSIKDDDNTLNVQLAGKIYEYFIGRDQSAISELGAYFSDRHITEYSINLVKPKLKNGQVPVMIDMFGGSGGFTLGYIDYLMKHNPDINWDTQLNNVYHFDTNNDVVNHAKLEMFCLTGSFPSENNVRNTNSFIDNFVDVNTNTNQKYQFLLTNPPYGGDKTKKSESISIKEEINKVIMAGFKEKHNIRTITQFKKLQLDDSEEKIRQQFFNNDYDIKIYNKKQKDDQVSLASIKNPRFNKYADDNNLNKAKCNDKESVSLLMMMELLDVGGTALGILKEGVFFNDKYQFLRKHLVENFDIERIVSIDSKQFENTDTKTSIIVFHNNGKKTLQIKFYDLVVEKDTKTSIVFNEETGLYEASSVKDFIRNVSDKHLTTATYNDIVANDYTFNYKKYNVKQLVPGDGYKLVKLGDVCELKNGKQLNKKDIIKGNYPVYSGGQNIIGKHNKYNRDGEYIIVSGTGSCGITNYYNGKFWASQCFTIKSIKKNINIKYIYDISKTILEPLFTSFNSGSAQPFIRANQFINSLIPIPEDETKMIEWVERINEPYDVIQESKKRVKELEKEVQQRITEINETEETEEVALGELCELKDGYDFYRRDMDERKRYVENENLPLFKINSNQVSDYVRINNKFKNSIVNKGDLVIGTKGTCGQIRVINLKGYHKHGLLKFTNLKINKSMLYYLILILLTGDNIESMSSKSVLSNMRKSELIKFKITLPKDRKVIDTLNPLFEEIDTLNEAIPKYEADYEVQITALRKEAIKE
jgi:type I restriction-modification system DNA methylase subunit